MVKKLALIALTTVFALFALWSVQAGYNPRYPLDLAGDIVDQGMNGGGAGSGGGE